MASSSSKNQQEDFKNMTLEEIVEMLVKEMVWVKEMVRAAEERLKEIETKEAATPKDSQSEPSENMMQATSKRKRTESAMES